MDASDFVTTFRVDRSPEEVFGAITRVRGWWWGEVGGQTDRVGARFTYRVPGVHECTMEIEEMVPGERVVWHVIDGRIVHADPPTEWNGTRIRFDIARVGRQTEVRFTHEGLVPTLTCYGRCAGAWTKLVTESLRQLIRTGEDQPSPWA